MSVATESEPDTWISVIRGNLNDLRGIPCDEQPGKKMFAFLATEARYARFEAISFYGSGAALQYFDMN